MENNGKRENWTGSLGFILAAAGSAVGLGNIWKFPYITGEYGGGAFVLVYLVCIAVIGIPVMLCEISLGRHTQKNPVGAFKQLTPKVSASAHLLGFGMIIVGIALLCFQQWGFGVLGIAIGLCISIFSWTMVGVMGVLSGFVILSFYSVVAGWTIGYTVKSISGDIDATPSRQKTAVLAGIIMDHVKKVPESIKRELQRAEKLKELPPFEIPDNLEQAAQSNAIVVTNKIFKISLPIPADGKLMNKREFRDYYAEQLGKLVDRKNLEGEVVKLYGGMVPVTGDDGKVTMHYSKKLKTAITGKQFGLFIDNPAYAILFHLIFMLMCIGIVCLGVQGGIEKASKILMPLLFLLVIVLIIRGITLDGAIKGVKFYLSPDFSKLTPESVLVALGHAFFSLSLGMGAMITYGSYVSKKENLFISTLSVVALDTLIALMAGLAIFPAVFAMGFDPSAGPGLVFQTLPAVFNGMPAGPLWATLFFLLLLVAALTSGVSLLEVVTAYFVDERKWNRKVAAIVVGGIIFGLGALSAISISDWDRLPTLHRGLLLAFGATKDSFFDVMDMLGSNYFLPLGGLFTSLFVGWIWGTRKAVEEIRHGSCNFADVHLISLLAGLNDDPSHNSEYHVLTLAAMWGIFIRFISPVAVAIAFMHEIGWI